MRLWVCDVRECMQGVRPGIWDGAAVITCLVFICLRGIDCASAYSSPVWCSSLLCTRPSYQAGVTEKLLYWTDWPVISSFYGVINDWMINHAGDAVIILGQPKYLGNPLRAASGFMNPATKVIALSYSENEAREEQWANHNVWTKWACSVTWIIFFRPA